MADLRNKIPATGQSRVAGVLPSSEPKTHHRCPESLEATTAVSAGVVTATDRQAQPRRQRAPHVHLKL
nr:hypothetical protein Itr_chr01CG09480 [Ipomoea trifida]